MGDIGIRCPGLVTPPNIPKIQKALFAELFVFLFSFCCIVFFIFALLTRVFIFYFMAIWDHLLHRVSILAGGIETIFGVRTPTAVGVKYCVSMFQ